MASQVGWGDPWKNHTNLQLQPTFSTPKNNKWKIVKNSKEISLEGAANGAREAGRRKNMSI